MKLSNSLFLFSRLNFASVRTISWYKTETCLLFAVSSHPFESSPVVIAYNEDRCSARRIQLTSYVKLGEKHTPHTNTPTPPHPHPPTHTPYTPTHTPYTPTHTPHPIHPTPPHTTHTHTQNSRTRGDRKPRPDPEFVKRGGRVPVKRGRVANIAPKSAEFA